MSARQVQESGTIRFFVPGMPRTAGSKRAFPIRRRDGSLVRIALTDASGVRGREWRAVVQDRALESFGEFGSLLEGPLAVGFTFVVPRPKGHSGARGLRPSAPEYPATKPDVLKLARAVEDALTGVLWRDDAQIVTEVLRKRYGAPAGCWIEIAPVTGPVLPEAAMPGEQAA